MAVYTVMVITGVESVMVSAIVFAARNVFGYLFSSETEVVDYVRTMAPLVSLSVIFDALHAVLSGVARGSGRQDIGAYVNLAAYYLFGIPAAAVLGFRFKMSGRGLWIGITVGSCVQAVLLGLIVSLTNWKQQYKSCKRTRSRETERARIAVYTVMVMAGVESLMVSAIVFAARNEYGYLFSSETEVVDYVRTMAPLVSLSVIFDALHAVLSGVARGSGRQDIGAYVNLAAYYLFGIPTAVVLGFRFNMRGRGLWIGITVGSCVQAVLLSLIVIFTNWKQQARKARERVMGDEFEDDEHD
ncbi:hypothetical protein Bca52824_052746 [Brassica carinata]|uniref:Uncharacterized protein n=4 Tax=Brassica TaxID=3705 RepID=A0A8X7UMK7_BRACI|nr:hypothetical protein Bca52824_052746 [Brassica carinata]